MKVIKKEVKCPTLFDTLIPFLIKRSNLATHLDRTHHVATKFTAQMAQKLIDNDYTTDVVLTSNIDDPNSWVIEKGIDLCVLAALISDPTDPYRLFLDTDTFEVVSTRTDPIKVNGKYMSLFSLLDTFLFLKNIEELQLSGQTIGRLKQINLYDYVVPVTYVIYKGGQNENI